MENLVADIEAQTRNNVDRVEAAPVFKRARYPVTLKFEDVVYKIKIQRGGSPVKNIKSEEKVILKGMVGTVKPGEILAMLGPSGSGKTTLLTALGGRLQLGRLHGRITYNGEPLTNSMKRNTAFVAQDNVLYPHLTVRETLIFTALLRLPNSLTEDEKIMHAEAVIDQLGLTKCQNNIIGGPFLRGVSGGERKRVSIGQEMLINPSVMFLDEPTSSLDSTTAQQIVSTLWKLANGGRTVVMTVHQPSSRLFYMFHKVLLLSEGSPLYFGEACGAMDYFASIGYCPSLSMNPSDFLLDLANGVLSNNDSQEEQQRMKRTLVSSYKKLLADKLKAELQENEIFPPEGLEDKEFGRWSTTWWQQCRLLFRRGVKERVYSSFCDIILIQVLTAAFLSGLLWWKSDVSHIQNRIGLLFFYVQFWGFLPISQAIYTFPQERLMLEKERSSGMYKLSAYFMSRILGDLPMELALPTIFVTVTYWMAGLKFTIGNFLHTLFVLLFSVLVSQGLGLAIGAIVMDVKGATKLGSTIVLLFVLTGGFFVQDVPPFIAWIKNFSISHHTYKLLLGSQYKPTDTYPCGISEGFCLVEEYPAIKRLGLDVDGQILSVVAMALMLVGYRLIAYIALKRIGVTRVKTA